MDGVSGRSGERGERWWKGEEEDEEGRIEGMTAFCIFTHFSLTSFNP